MLAPLIWREFKIHSSKALALNHLLGPTSYLVFLGLSISFNFGTVPYQGMAVSYLHFIIPGLIAIQTYQLFATTFSLTRLDISTKMITLIMTSTSFVNYMVAKIAFGMLVSLATSAYLLGLGWVIAGPTEVTLSGLLTMVAGIALGDLLFFSLGLLMGLKIRREDVRDAIFALAGTPALFSSTAFYPMDRVPAPLRLVARLNPISHIADIVRAGYLNASPDPLTCLLLAAYVAAAAGVTYRAVRRFVVK